MTRIFRRGGASAPVPSTSISDAYDLHYELTTELDGTPLPSASDAARIAARSRAAGHEWDGESMYSIPQSLAKRVGRKKSIPKDWRDLQSLHLKESQREEAKALSRRGSLSTHKVQNSNLEGARCVEGDEGCENNFKRVDSGYRTMRRTSMMPIQAKGCDEETRAPLVQTRIDKASFSTFVKSNSDPSLSARPPDDSTNYALGTKTLGRNVNSRSFKPISTSLFSDLNPNNLASATGSSLVVVQAGDEDLDSDGLRQAMSTLKAENERLLAQFKDLELKLYEKYGDPASAVMRSSISTGRHAMRDDRRRESLSMSYLESGTSGRRMSVSPSVFSAPDSCTSVLGQSGGSLPPGSSSMLSRRPSKASSIASSALMRRGFSSSSGTQHGSFDTYATSIRPPSTVQKEELLFSAIEAEFSGDDGSSVSALTARQSIRDPQYEQELQLLNERRRNIEERYAARLEYLEARLQGQLQKEKLRR